VTLFGWKLRNKTIAASSGWFCLWCLIKGTNPDGDGTISLKSVNYPPMPQGASKPSFPLAHQQNSIRLGLQ
jgi:hypothetical protein